MSKNEGAPMISMDQLNELLASRDAANLEAMKTLIIELKKPTVMEQKKLDEEQRRIERKQADRIRNARSEEQSRELRKKHCPHGSMTAAGVVKHTWRAQVNADGYFRPMCEQCQTQLPPIKATQHQMQNGVDLHRYAGLSVEILEKWAADSAKQTAVEVGR